MKRLLNGFVTGLRNAGALKAGLFLAALAIPTLALADRDWDHRWDRGREFHRAGGSGSIHVRIGTGGPGPVVVKQPQQVWVEAVYTTVTDRVWVPQTVQTVTERVWVADRYEWRDVVRKERHHRRCIVREQVLVEPAHHEDRPRQVITPGHYEDVQRQVVVTPGHWETRMVPVATQSVDRGPFAWIGLRLPIRQH